MVENTNGDATLRSNMNWEAITNNAETKKLLNHWQKLGQFRRNHPAVGAGIHQMITEAPYLFYRSFQKDDYKDFVVVGLDLPEGEKVLDVSKVFENGDTLYDTYSGTTVKVKQGKVKINTPFSIVLLEQL